MPKTNQTFAIMSPVHLPAGDAAGGGRVYLLVECAKDQPPTGIKDPPGPAASLKAAEAEVDDEGPLHWRLTARQYQILMALREGASNKEIARRLGIVESTVKVQLKSVYRELRVKNRTQAAMIAARHATARAEREPLPRLPATFALTPAPVKWPTEV